MQDSKKPIIQSIRDYVLLNPDIDDRKININYLGNGMEYSIDPIGADPNYKKYVDGGGLKQFQFAFTRKHMTAMQEPGLPTVVFIRLLRNGLRKII